MLEASELFPGDESQFPIPNQLFRKVSELLRTAEYARPFLYEEALPGLQKFSRDLQVYAKGEQREFTEREAVHFLWSLCLQAELHDYAAKPHLARKVIEESGKELEGKLRDGMLGLSATPGFSKRLFRQQLWTLVFWSHCHYRDEEDEGHLDRAAALLRQIHRQIQLKLLADSKNGQPEPSFGLRARVAYSLGQVYRQMSDVKKAREQFLSALEFTRKRLEEKAKKYSGVDLVREQEFAKYVIAKTFSFGLAWASYNSGELQRARGSAAGGCALLETMHDPVHKAYAQVVYAGILIAKAQPVRRGEAVPEELEEAISMLGHLVNEKTSPLRGVRRLFARARFTLAGALYAAGRHSEASEHAQDIYRAEQAGSRWHLECGILLTRLLLEKEDHGVEARKQSDELMRLISGQRNVFPDVRIAVLLCHADVLMGLNDADRNGIRELLSQARVLAATNPLSMALCHLYWAQYYGLAGRLGDAHDELAQWDAMEAHVEHGNVRELASRVKQKIDALDGKLVIDRELFYQEEGLEKVKKEYRRWLISRLFEKFPSPRPSEAQCKSTLGIGRATLRSWMNFAEFDPWVAGRPVTSSETQPQAEEPESD